MVGVKITWSRHNPFHIKLILSSCYFLIKGEYIRIYPSPDPQKQLLYKGLLEQSTRESFTGLEILTNSDY